jgi:hypothetical protein
MHTKFVTKIFCLFLYMYMSKKWHPPFSYVAVCDEQCSLHGGVCDNGKCEFRCSDYAGYTCQKGSAILPSLSMCHDVLVRDDDGQHCAPSELSILQQLEAVVLVPNYNRLMPSGRTFLNFFNNANCAAAAKRLACWVLLSLTTCLNFFHELFLHFQVF